MCKYDTRILEGRLSHALTTGTFYFDPVLQDKVIMEGWLSKETKGGFFKSTQKRWCVLKHGNLSYFHSQKDAADKAKAPGVSLQLADILGVSVDR
jgi:hypothetical protein